MKAIKLRLERDPDIPAFHRLRYEWTEASLREVLLEGIHPWQGSHAHPSLLAAFTQRLNASALKPRDLVSRGYTPDFQRGSSYYGYRRRSRLEELLTQVGEQIIFVEDSFACEDLLSLAKDALSHRWTHRTVRNLLHGMLLDFNSLRRFLRSKAPEIKLRGYADIDGYDLGSLLMLSDFEGLEDLLIRQAIPRANFRCARFLDGVADERGRLRLIPEITDFQLRVMRSDPIAPFQSLTYNCHREGERVRLIPHLGRRREAREVARQMAAEWTQGKRRYCFAVGLEELSQMLGEQRIRIDFSSLNYTIPKPPPEAEAKVRDLALPHYQVGPHITVQDTTETMREMLRAYGVSMTGNKKRLVEKLAKLSAMVYREREVSLDAYFASDRFIRTGRSAGPYGCSFDLLEQCSLREMVLTMYLIRHLRADAIVDASYLDDSYDLEALAAALLNERVSLKGAFLRVEDDHQG